jgi:protein-tyrosine phosphatase
LKIIAVPDSLDLSILDYLPRCSEFIERHRKHTNVMVHCFAGISRSATCVIAYLMEKFDWGYKRAFEMVKAIRK